MEKNTEHIHKFWDSQAFSRNSADLDKATRLLFYIFYITKKKDWISLA